MDAETVAPGRNVAILRKARGMSQVALARRAGVSVSLLSKVEVGDRTLSQGVAACLAKAMGVTLDELLGRAAIAYRDEAALNDLRSAIRRFDLPGGVATTAAALKADLAGVVRMRGDADLSGVLRRLPALVSQATNHAHAVGTPLAWALVVDVYSAVYWLAARHRWMDLAELAVARQGTAAQRADPLAMAIAARDEAGAFLNSGDFSGGLAVVERAIIRADAALDGRDKAFGLGLLHLRGMTLAGRLGDGPEADRHVVAAWRIAADFGADADDHGIHFGPENTATHVVATCVDLEDHRGALNAAESFMRQPVSLPATRVGPVHLNLSRAKLALGDRDGSLDSLIAAWNAAPQMAKVHPTSQELIRVLTSLHKRSNPKLTMLSRKAGIVL